MKLNVTRLIHFWLYQTYCFCRKDVCVPQHVHIEKISLQNSMIYSLRISWKELRCRFYETCPLKLFEKFVSIFITEGLVYFSSKNIRQSSIQKYLPFLNENYLRKWKIVNFYILIDGYCQPKRCLIVMILGYPVLPRHVE